MPVRTLALFALLTAGLPSGVRAADPAPLTIVVDATAGRIPISPYLYGKNGNLAGTSANLWGPEVGLANEAGLRLSRESDGNNGTKYNWRNDLSSHPDWYNNCYPQNWPKRARTIQDQAPHTDGLFALPVLGWVAKTDRFNADENKLDPQHKDPHQNLAGGGVATLYLESVTPAETVGIFDHWFSRSPDGLGLDKSRFRLWHLDNEPECWRSTHHDISGTLMTGEACVAKYVAVAKEAKTRYPDVQLMAPGFASEWFWWNWSDQNCVGGLPWMQYFIKRMAEESKAFGRPLIDLVDIHTYIDGTGSDDDALQEHRVWFDPGYAFPKANGCKRGTDCGWHDDQRVEMVLARLQGWIDQYFGPHSGVGIGTTESGLNSKHAMVRALDYASNLGDFADHGVRVYTPWYWYDESWEVLHLFSRYAGTIRVSASTTGEPMVSCYASVSDRGDRVTAIVVNRSDGAARTADLTVNDFRVRDGRVPTLVLANLPDGRRTFQTHEKNALQHGYAPARVGRVHLVLPPRSITAVLLTAAH